MRIESFSAHQESVGTKKCPQCGLVNFSDAKVCKRCKSSLDANSFGQPPTTEEVASDYTSKRTPQTWIAIAIFLTIILSVVVYKNSKSRKPANATITETNGATTNSATQTTPEQDAEAQRMLEATSKEAATNIVEKMHRMESKIAGLLGYDQYQYNQYNQELNALASEVRGSLANFESRNRDDDFVRETSAALKDYMAARDWWKTTLQYSNTFTESDRTEKLKNHWQSANTHIANAEKAMLNKQ